MTRRSKSPAIIKRYGLRRHLYQGRALLKSHCASPSPAIVSDSAKDTENLQEDLVQLRDTVIRQRAEFDNFRKRSVREKDQVREAAAENVLAKLLPVIDNMERALASAETAADVKPVRDGVAMILLQLQRVLQAEGLEKIESFNQPFDPLIHDALAAEPRTDIPDNHVCEVLLPAYKYKEKVLRAAMVKVAKTPAAEESTT